MQTFSIAADSEVVVVDGFPTPSLPVKPERRRVAVLHQGPVQALATELIEHCSLTESLLIELPDRDRSKTWQEVATLYDELARFNLGRQDTIVGVGGGAATDVAGFVAATWLRGVESVLVPTTLLGAVDAAIGGKTGINHAGKNLVGAFWLPSRVIVRLDVLETLDVALRTEGAAEIVKAGLIAEPAIIRLYERFGPDAPLGRLVPAAIGVKVDVIREDLREADRRMILNLGHTIGHGIEAASGLAHGLAVSIGLVAAAAISHQRYGFDARRVTDLLSALGLPTTADGISPADVRAYVSRDKKKTSEGTVMVLLRDIADPVVDLVEENELRLGLAAVGIE